MGTARNQMRLETIEKSLTPRELVNCCIEERAKFNSAADYAAWLAEDLSRAPGSRVLAQIAGDSVKGPSGTKQSSRLRRQHVGDAMFLFRLIRLLDREVRDLIGRDRLRLATVGFGLLAADHSITSGLAMLQLNDWLTGVTPRDDAKLSAAVAFTADAADEFRRCGSAFGLPGIAQSMKFVRAELYAALINVRATIAAVDRIGAKYFKGIKVIFKSDAEALDTLAQRAAGMVSNYNKLAELLATITFDSGVIEGAETIDQKQIERAVGEKGANLPDQWVVLAHAETLLLLEEREEDAKKAFKLLRPMLEAEVRASA